MLYNFKKKSNPINIHVFQVKHFSKYGLVDDSDEENDQVEKDPKKLKLLQEEQQKQLAIQVHSYCLTP